MPDKPTYRELSRRVKKLEQALKDSEAKLKETEESLRTSRTNFQNLFENAAFGIAICRLIKDEQGRPVDFEHIHVNDATKRHTGFDPNMIIGRRALEIAELEEVSSLIDIYGQVVAEGKAYEYEQHFTLYDRHLHVGAFALKDDLFALTFIDITKLKKTEERLQDALLKQREAVKASNIGFWDWDLKTGKVQYSKELKAQIGYAENEISDDLEQWSSRVHPDDLQPTLDMVNRNIAEGRQDHRAEFRFRHRDGTYLWILTHAAIIRDEANRPIRMVGSHIDITDRKCTEQELRKSESMLQRVFEILPVGLWFADKNGKLLRGNPAGIRIWGGEPMVSIDEYGVFKARRLPSMEELAAEDWALSRTVRDGVTVRDELLEIDAFDGTKKTILNYTAPVLDKDGSVEAAVVVNLDISDTIRAEQAALQSEAQLSALIDNIPDLIWLKDRDGIYLSCNPTFERFFGASEAQIVGKSDYDFLDREQADFFREHDRKAEAAGGPRVNEEWITFKNGGYHGLFETIKTPMHDSDGKIMGVLGIARDITNRYRAEKELKEKRDLFELVINSVPDRVFWKDLNLVYLGCNIHFAQDSGLETPEDVVGKNDYDLVWKEDAEIYRADDMQVIKTGKARIKYEKPFFNRDGEKIIWMTSKIPLKNAEGKIIGIIAVSEDITEKKLAEEKKQRLEAQLRQSQKMESIGNLAGGIAHDFNNILSSIIGFTEIALDETPEGTTVEESLQEVYSAGKRAKDLVQQILAFARQSEEKKTPLQPVKIAREVLKLIRSTIPATIQIQQEFESESWIMGNASQIHQVLMNLCTNAAYAMEDSGGILKISMREVSFDQEGSPAGIEAGDHIKIEVADTGSGIAPEIIDLIFEPYFTTKGVGEGTGIGLAMVQGVIESCGGKIAVESQPAKGTTFTIYLPLTEKKSSHESYMTEPLPAGSEHILFVDDELSITKLSTRILERQGYRVTAFTSSVEALELFKKRPNDFDLIITDMTMPSMTGDQLAVESMNIRDDIPVILCTGYSRKISDDSAAKIGIKALIYKPVVKADLIGTIRKVLDEARAGVMG